MDQQSLEGRPGRYWHRLDDGRIQCDLCPRYCKLHESQRGLCFVRGRQDDQIVLTAYGRSSGFCDSQITQRCRLHPSTAWSRSPGMGGRDQSERLVAINRNQWSQSAGARTEVADRAKIRRIERHNPHKIVPSAAGLRDPPRRIQPTRIAVQQKRHHHPRIKRRLPEPAHIAARDLLEIEALPHQLNDKPRDMAFRHEVLHIRRQKQPLIDIPGTKILAHSPSLNQTRSELNSDYSDRLLGYSTSPERQTAGANFCYRSILKPPKHLALPR